MGGLLKNHLWDYWLYEITLEDDLYDNPESIETAHKLNEMREFLRDLSCDSLSPEQEVYGHQIIAWAKNYIRGQGLTWDEAVEFVRDDLLSVGRSHVIIEWYNTEELMKELPEGSVLYGTGEQYTIFREWSEFENRSEREYVIDLRN